MTLETSCGNIFFPPDYLSKSYHLLYKAGKKAKFKGGFQNLVFDYHFLTLHIIQCNMPSEPIINIVQGEQQVTLFLFWLQGYSFMFNSCFTI
jgi:hypothetical protein